MNRSEHGVHRRIVADDRLDGMRDVLNRVNGASVFDVGCNRGAICYEFAQAGAALLQGCDIYAMGITVAREWFADMREVKHRFEVVDLTGGIAAIDKAFAGTLSSYDVLLYIAVHHKLARQMPPAAHDALIVELARRARRFICWRGSDEFNHLDALFARAGNFRRVQFSNIGPEGNCAVWRKN